MKLIMFTSLILRMTFVLETIQAIKFHKVNEGLCPEISSVSPSILSRELFSSVLDCARSCAKIELCRLFKFTSSGKCWAWREPSSSNVTSLPIQPRISFDNWPSPHDENGSCYLHGDLGAMENETPEESCKNESMACSPEDTVYQDYSPYLEYSDWVPKLVTNASSGGTWVNFGERVARREGNLVFRNESTGTTYVVYINSMEYEDNKARISTLYSMEHDQQGFVVNASRVMYSYAMAGRNLYTSVWHPDGTYQVSVDTKPSLKIFVELPDPFTIVVMPGSDPVDTLVQLAENGYRAISTKYTVMNSAKPAVTFYNLEGILSCYAKAKPVQPLLHQFRVVKNYNKRFYSVKLGKPHSLVIADRVGNKPLVFSPLWKSTNETNDLDTEQLIGKLVRLMYQGRNFRVKVNNAFFSVDFVRKKGEEIYFVLPQQGSTPNLNADSVGKRAFVSARGLYSLCTHHFEGEGALETGFLEGQEVKHFVDTRARTASFSVFANGTVAFGHVAGLAVSARAGRDFKVLVEWLREDVAVQFSTCMVKVHETGDGRPLVSAESRASWRLEGTPDGKMAVNDECDMEKVLVFSDGRVQVLTYNVRSRRPVVDALDTRTTFFVDTPP